MAKVQKFEELKIWQVAREIAKCVYELTIPYFLNRFPAQSSLFRDCLVARGVVLVQAARTPLPLCLGVSCPTYFARRLT